VAVGRRGLAALGAAAMPTISAKPTPKGRFSGAVNRLTGVPRPRMVLGGVSARGAAVDSGLAGLQLGQPLVDLVAAHQVVQLLQAGGLLQRLGACRAAQPRLAFIQPLEGVGDLADAVLFCLEHYRDTDQHINVGSGVEVSIRELGERVKEVVGFEGNIRWDHTKPDGTPRKLMDCSKTVSFVLEI